MNKQAKNTICLWYNGDAEDAARFYAQTFPTRPSARCTARRETFPPAKKETC
jgi:2-polyprenyl-6-hydroxyphenyl methylase/3-demethylubiquinone-9 3-methyltransferase